MHWAMDGRPQDPSNEVFQIQKREGKVKKFPYALTMSFVWSIIAVIVLGASRQTIAGNWTDDPSQSSYSNSPPFSKSTMVKKSTTLTGTPYIQTFQNASTRARSTSSGGSCAAFAQTEANSLTVWMNSFSAVAESGEASAQGLKTKSHGLPSHGQNAVQGRYRASATFNLSYDATCTATGASSTVAGGGAANAAGGVSDPPSYTLSIRNITCGTSTVTEFAGSISYNGVGVGLTKMVPQIGRYDSGGRQLSKYSYRTAETETRSGSIKFPWRCDASAKMTSIAQSGLIYSSCGVGKITMESSVEDVTLDVVDPSPSGP